MVITKLAEITGMKDMQVVICPTTREADGLAMSSRNRRLTEPQKGGGRDYLPMSRFYPVKTKYRQLSAS